MAHPHDPPPPKPKKQCSEAQLNANRANAQKSTGPRTPAGKLRSSLNNYQHGRRAKALLIPGESGEELQLLSDIFVDQLGAATVPEMFQAQSAAESLDGPAPCLTAPRHSMLLGAYPGATSRASRRPGRAE